LCAFRTNNKAPAYFGPTYANWTGFYLGINGGYAWGDSEWSGGDLCAVAPTNVDFKSSIVRLGVNYRF
jgi:hypothetical protein